MHNLSADVITRTVLVPGPRRDEVLAEIRAEMARQRVTQESLAGKAGMTQWQLSRRLLGNVQITVEEVQRIADALEVPASRLLVAGEPV